MSSFSVMFDPEFENIYNLVPKPAVNVTKPPMYRSKHNPLAPIQFSTNTNRGPNIGKVKNDKDPANFLRASTPSKRIPLKHTSNKFNYPQPVAPKAKVPSKSERPGESVVVVVGGRQATRQQGNSRAKLNPSF